MTIEGIPEGWEEVRVGTPNVGEHYIGRDRYVCKCEREPGGSGWLIIRKIEKPKQYRPFANAAEFEPFRDRWVYSPEERDDNPEGAESPEDGHSKVTTYSESGVTIDGYAFCFDTAFRYFVFDDDGTPFGIEVTE